MHVVKKNIVLALISIHFSFWKSSQLFFNCIPSEPEGNGMPVDPLHFSPHALVWNQHPHASASVCACLCHWVMWENPSYCPAELLLFLTYDCLNGGGGAGCTVSLNLWELPWTGIVRKGNTWIMVSAEHTFKKQNWEVWNFEQNSAVKSTISGCVQESL